MATPTTLPATFVSGNTLLASQLNDLRGAFRVLQVVTATTTTAATTTAGSYASTGLTATITPSSTSSQVLVLVSAPMGFASGVSFYATVFRGTTAGTNLGGGTGNALVELYSTAAATTITQVAISVLDSPATASAQTYTLAFNSTNGFFCILGRSKATMTLMEISA